MARRLEFPPAPAVAGQMAIADFVGPEKAARKRGGVHGTRARGGPRAQVERASREAREIIDEGGSWASAAPRLLVGLYAVMHQEVYGVEPEELAGAWLPAVGAATRLAEELGPEGVVSFIRFVWKGERAAEKRAAGTGTVRRRVGWYLQFVHRGLLVDFRRAMLVNGKARR